MTKKINLKHGGYSKEYDILYQHWGGQTEHSVELFNGQLILDIDKDNNIVGMEIFDFLKELKKHDEKMKRLFKKNKK